jgi:Ca-activated chloride channel family protein
MEGVKKVVREFIQARTQDRIGLVVFGGRAFLQSPLTKDHRFLLDAVDALQPGIAGDGTAMGDAMGTALKRLQQLPAKTKTIVVVTDGASNAGQVQPQTAAEISQKLSIKIHTIGVGASDENEAPFDEAVLRDVAATTEGIYRNAADIAALRSVTQEIEKLIETESRTTNSKTIEDFSWVGGLLAVIAAALSFVIRGILYPVSSQRGVRA